MSEYTKTDCPSYGTEFCAILGQESCESCRMLDQKPEFVKQAMEDMALIKNMLPDGSNSSLYESEKCLLCKGEPRKREYYAIADMGHPEPQGTKTSAIGLKVKTRVGSLVPLQIACCDKCRKNHGIASYINATIMIAFIGLWLLILSIPAVNSSLSAIVEMLPLLLFVAMVLLAYVLGRIVKSQFLKRKSRETIFDVRQIPYVKRMVDAGWFPLYGDGPVTRLVFSKMRLKHGWFI